MQLVASEFWEPKYHHRLEQHFSSLFFQRSASSHTEHIHQSSKIYIKQLPLQLTYQQTRPWHSWVDISQVTTASSEFPQVPWPLPGKANLKHRISTSTVPTSVCNPSHVSLTTYLLQEQQSKLWLLQSAFILPGINFSLKTFWHFHGSETVTKKAFSHLPSPSLHPECNTGAQLQAGTVYLMQGSCLAPSWNWPKQGADRARLIHESPGPFSRVTMGKAILTPT